MRPGRMEICPALGRPRSASCWVDQENAAQGLGGLSSRELLSCPSRPEWLRLECDFEPREAIAISAVCGISQPSGLLPITSDQSKPCRCVLHAKTASRVLAVRWAPKHLD